MQNEIKLKVESTIRKNQAVETIKSILLSDCGGVGHDTQLNAYLNTLNDMTINQLETKLNEIQSEIYFAVGL